MHLFFVIPLGSRELIKHVGVIPMLLIVAANVFHHIPTLPSLPHVLPTVTYVCARKSASICDGASVRNCLARVVIYGLPILLTQSTTDISVSTPCQISYDG